MEGRRKSRCHWEVIENLVSLEFQKPWEKKDFKKDIVIGCAKCDWEIKEADLIGRS